MHLFLSLRALRSAPASTPATATPALAGDPGPAAAWNENPYPFTQGSAIRRFAGLAPPWATLIHPSNNTELLGTPVCRGASSQKKTQDPSTTLRMTRHLWAYGRAIAAPLGDNMQDGSIRQSALGTRLRLKIEQP